MIREVQKAMDMKQRKRLILPGIISRYFKEEIVFKKVLERQKKKIKNIVLGLLFLAMTELLALDFNRPSH